MQTNLMAQPQQLEQLYAQRLKNALEQVNKVIESAAFNNVALALNINIKVLSKFNTEVFLFDYEG